MYIFEGEKMENCPPDSLKLIPANTVELNRFLPVAAVQNFLNGIFSVGLAQSLPGDFLFFLFVIFVRQQTHQNDGEAWTQVEASPGPHVKNRVFSICTAER